MSETHTEQEIAATITKALTPQPAKLRAELDRLHNDLAAMEDQSVNVAELEAIVDELRAELQVATLLVDDKNKEVRFLKGKLKKFYGGKPIPRYDGPGVQISL